MRIFRRIEKKCREWGGRKGQQSREYQVRGGVWNLPNEH